MAAKTKNSRNGSDWTEIAQPHQDNNKEIPFPDLLAQLADTDRRISVASLHRLSDLNREDLDRLAMAWPAMAAQRRRQIMRMLVDISESNFEVDFEPVAHMALADEDAEVRVAAIEGLWESEDAALVPELLRLLTNDPEPSVRAAAAAGLGAFVLLDELGKLRRQAEIRPDQALMEVMDAADEDLEVRRRAVESLGYSGHKRVPEIIEAAYYHDNERMRISAVFAMGRSADARWLPIVLDELDSPNAEMRYEAARAAGELEARQAVPTLVEMIEDPDREVQEAAVWALGEIGGRQAQEALEAVLEDGDDLLAETAEEALDTLAVMGGMDEFPLFAFEDDDEDDVE
jgi:HEAT repeat protein